MQLRNFALGEWVAGSGSLTDLHDATTGEVIARAGSGGLDFAEMAEYARSVGGPALRALTFHQRAARLKELARYLTERKEALYKLSTATGATKSDSFVDIDGGIGTLFVYSSKGRRELPDETFHVEGPMETLSKGGSFVGRHICVPLEGVAVHINAFNFPCWGMLEKLSPTLLAGVPAIVKPATLTSFLAEGLFQMIVESRILPEGSVQLICGSVGDLLDHLHEQDSVAFTGSASTGRKLRAHPTIVSQSVRFNMEADSLNCSVLGPDATPDSEEFGLFIKEVAREMTSKAGQKCTAIRRTIVPEAMMDDVIMALKKRLDGVRVGNPATEGVQMGPLAGRTQVNDVGNAVDALKGGASVVYGNGNGMKLIDADASRGAFFPITLLATNEPLRQSEPHNIEAFGPVNTVMPYKDLDEAVALARLGRGSLCGSLFTADDRVAREVVHGLAPYHGRIYVLNRHSAKESTGHGSPLPHLVHGGPGRAGGGEEMGGIRGVLHYMQRTAIQGSPTTITSVTSEWVPGAAQTGDRIHPFRKHFEELTVGETLITHRRTVTEADIVNFAAISGDHFYAHVDDIAAKDSIFGKRVAHGYFVLSAAAGLFVDPAPGPVLANYGLENLRFTKPVFAGDTIRARLTCKSKTVKDTPPDGVPQGVVAWDVGVSNQDDELVATYTILTLVRRVDPATANS